jgi:hypothetical protein
MAEDRVHFGLAVENLRILIKKRYVYYVGGPRGKSFSE